MTTSAPPIAPEAIVIPVKKSSGAFTRLLKYTAVRLISLFVTVVIGIFLTILIANMGGYVDTIRKAEIREGIMLRVNGSNLLDSLSQEDKLKQIDEMIRLEEKRLGLDQPFMIRTVNYMTDALTLNLGRAQKMSSDSGSRTVRLIILERLAPTLMLFGFSNIILFFGSVLIALNLSRNYGSFWDRFIVGLAPTSSAPGWFYGLFLIVIFAGVLGWFPFGGMVDSPPPDSSILYFFSLMDHLILPTVAIALSTLFLSAYNWRTFFLIFSSEDYVDMARAKGLSDRDIERRYILRPTLPTIITNFALILIYLWTGAPIMETVFNWPGLGRTLFQAVGLFDIPVIVGSTVIFAYLLAITVFALDFIFALVDPRVKIGSEGHKQ
ncbi:MAG TPA: ABC transporter permease [Anaerolineales bacterium]|nr:ABC transporter permease [Anaerolineales bacterium]